MCTHTHTCARKHTHTYAPAHTHTHIHTHTHTHTHTYTHTHTHTYTHTHTCTHTHTQYTWIDTMVTIMYTSSWRVFYMQLALSLSLFLTLANLSANDGYEWWTKHATRKKKQLCNIYIYIYIYRKFEVI